MPSNNMQSLMQNVTIGDLTVSVTATVDLTKTPHSIVYKATCGESHDHSRMSIEPNESTIAAHLDKWHNDAVMKLARRTAGHERNRILLLHKFQ